MQRRLVANWFFRNWQPITESEIMPTEKSELPSEELISKLRESNQSLVIASLQAQELQEKAEASIERQKEFLAMLAHELRNPLAPIAMAVGMLERITPAHPQLPYIQEVIDRQLSHITRLLEDLLDASRVTSGKITLKKSLLLLTDVMRSAVEISQPLLTKNCQQLNIDLPASPVLIDGDAVRLSQVFSNLLNNASKYSPPQQSISVSARPGAGGTIAISVKDQGVGIEADIQPFVFDLFTQSPRTLDRSEGGLGIGLSMVRTLVQLHGGTVHVNSDGLGFGSEFIVVLPVSGEAAMPEASLQRPAPPAAGCRILVIEDNVDANETLSFCLTAEGHSVTSAFDGPTGLAKAKEGPHDIVVCDVGLPGMDGHEVVRQMRLLRLSPEPHCIAMTGYEQPNPRAGGAENGFDHYLVKPVSLNTLQDVISRAMALAGSR